jgi:uncharacterized protein (DUF427 family)
MKAIRNGRTVAESDGTVVVEGSHYFPAGAVGKKYFGPSSAYTICSWNSTASYYDLDVDGKKNPDTAWYDPGPKGTARRSRGAWRSGRAWRWLNDRKGHEAPYSQSLE